MLRLVWLRANTCDFPCLGCYVVFMLIFKLFLFEWKFLSIWISYRKYIMNPCMSVYPPICVSPNKTDFISISDLLIIAIYVYYALGYRFTLKDAVRSALGLNILAAVIYPLNIALNSNYLYLVDKPPGTTIYNLLGPWP